MTRCLSFAAIALVCLIGSAAAQDAPPAQSTIGRVLTQARTSGALERVLRDRYFTYPMGPRHEGLTQVSARLEGKGDEQLLVYEVQIWLPGPRSGTVMQLQCTGAIGFDGALRRATTRQRMGQGEWLEQTLVPSDAIPSYGPDVVPVLFVAYFLASLHDQGLPPAFEGRPFHEAQLALGQGPLKLTSRQVPDVDGVRAQEVRVDLAAPDPRLELDAVITVQAAGATPGSILKAFMDGQKMPSEPLSVSEGEQRRSAFEEQPEGERKD